MIQLLYPLAMLGTGFALLVAIMASRRVVRTLIRSDGANCPESAFVAIDDDLAQYLKAYATGSADCAFVTASRLFGV